MDLNFIDILKVVPAAVIGLTVHECAHAYTAYKLGDNTAKNEGRISLNPLKHIDWIGFFLIIVAGFGWAKPVTFNPNNLKHKHRDEILISIAGPLSNFLLTIVFFGGARLLYCFDGIEFGIVQLFLIWGTINLALFIFNLIPIPPLDGSHLYMTFLNENHPKMTVNLYRYGMLGLFIIIIAENKFNVNILHISEMINTVSSFLVNLLGFK